MIKFLQNIKWKTVIFRITVIWFFLCLCILGPGHGKPYFTWTAQMQLLADKTEKEYNLPKGICRSFALQESNYDPNATREEGSYFNKGSKYYTLITLDSKEFLSRHPEYDNTLTIEKAQRSISYGIFQMMGQNFRILGYEKENINPDLEEQFHYFALFITKEYNKLHNIQKLASWYNTGNPLRIGRGYDINVLNNFKRFSK